MSVAMDTAITSSLLFLTGLICLFAPGEAQEGFTEPIECFECLDKAHNTTCGTSSDPVQLLELGTIKCKRGACVKWTYYRNRELQMRRTCSEMININIHLDNVCRRERNGNGYLCMCNLEFCNKAHANEISGLVLLGAAATFIVIHANLVWRLFTT